MSDTKKGTPAAQKGQKIKLNPAQKTTQVAGPIKAAPTQVEAVDGELAQSAAIRQPNTKQPKAQRPSSAQARDTGRSRRLSAVGGGGEGRPQRQSGLYQAGAQHQSRPRLFFALKVPAELATPLAEAQKALRGNWRAVRPDQFHVTLAYLPSVDPARIDDLKRLGTRLAQECAPLTVRLRGTGYFPNEGSPRVWFVKVEGEGLDQLAEQLRAELATLGLETEDTNFRAHITLARKKGPAPRVPPRIFDLHWQAPQMVLYRSHLQKTGPIYEVLSTFKFRGE